MARLHLIVCVLAAVVAALEAKSVGGSRALGAPTCSLTPACPSKKAATLANPCKRGCQYYYECDKKGNRTPMACLPWMSFHPTNLRCDFIDQVDCSWSESFRPGPTTARPAPGPTDDDDYYGDENDSNATDAPGPNDPVTVPPTAAPSPKPIVDGCDFVPQCPATGSSTMGIPCKDSCSSYVQCNNGKYTVEKCGWLYGYYDTILERCVVYGPLCAEDV